jgi:aminoglycoside phosphotransferase (APT) family kinase protein
MEWAYRWLRANVGFGARTTRLVHGDFNLKNILVHDGRVSGLIDFELTRLGHPAEDLGAIRPEAEQVMPWAEFLSIYQRAGGAEITPEELRFCDVWTAYRYRIICAMAGHVHATGQSGEIFFTLAERLESPRLLTVLVRALQYDPRAARR